MKINNQITKKLNTNYTHDLDRGKPLVSIGMPVYNGELFIREALDSLLAQTFVDFELIISDNASTDGTDEICKQYAANDTRIRYVRKTENVGAAANFQCVLEASVGEYFMWAAADDIRSSDCIETYLKHIGRSGGVFTTFAVLDRECNAISRCEVPTMSVSDSNRELLRIFFKNNITSMIYGLFRKETLMRCAPFEKFDWSDSYLIIKIISESKFIMLTTKEPKYFAGRYGEYEVKKYFGNYLKPHKYFVKALPYAIKSGGFSVLYLTKCLIVSYRINFQIFKKISALKYES